MAIYVYSEATGLFAEYEPVKAVVDPAVGFVPMAEAWVASDGVFFPLWPILPPTAPIGSVSIQPTWNTATNRYEFQIAWTGGGLYVTSWEVQRRQYSDAGPGPYTTVATPAAATTTYTELDGWGQQRYGYKIRGIGQAGTGPFSNEVIVDTLPQMDPGAYPAIDDGAFGGDFLVSNPVVGFDNGQPSWQIRAELPKIGPYTADVAPYVYWSIADIGLTLRTTDAVAHFIQASYFNDGTPGPYWLQKTVVFDVPGTYAWSGDVVVEAMYHGFVNGVEWTRVAPHTFNLGGPGAPAAPAAVGCRPYAGDIFRVDWFEVANASSYIVTVNDLTASAQMFQVEVAGTEVSPGLRRLDTASFGATVGHTYQATVAAKNVAATSAATASNNAVKVANPIDFIPPLRQTWDTTSGWIGASDGFMYQGYAFAMDFAVGMFGAFPIHTQIGPAAIGYQLTCTAMQVFGKTLAGGTNNPSLTGLVLHKVGSQFQNFSVDAAIIGGHREYTTQNVPFTLSPPSNYGDILIAGASNGYVGVAFWAPETSPQPAPHFQVHDKNTVIFAPNIVPLTVRIYHDG